MYLADSSFLEGIDSPIKMILGRSNPEHLGHLGGIEILSS
jgi:hypothetical protein